MNKFSRESKSSQKVLNPKLPRQRCWQDTTDTGKMFLRFFFFLPKKQQLKDPKSAIVLLFTPGVTRPGPLLVLLLQTRVHGSVEGLVLGGRGRESRSFFLSYGFSNK